MVSKVGGGGGGGGGGRGAHCVFVFYEGYQNFVSALWQQLCIVFLKYYFIVTLGRCV